MTISCNQLIVLADIRRGTPSEPNGCYFQDLEMLVRQGLIVNNGRSLQITALGMAYIEKCLTLSYEIQYVFS